MISKSAIELNVLADELSIHRLPASTSLPDVLSSLPDQPANSSVFATLHSDEELSIVCAAHLAVAAEQTTGPWRALRVVGELDFALTGILAGLAAPLAAANISIFAISSYNTDYLLVRADALQQALQTLNAAGYSVNDHASTATT